MTSVRSFTKSCCLSYSYNRCKWELLSLLRTLVTLTSVGPLLFSFLLRNRMRTEVMAWDNRLEQSTLASCRSNAHKYWGFEFTKILRIRIHTKTEDYNSYVQILGTGIHKDTALLWFAFYDNWFEIPMFIFVVYGNKCYKKKKYKKILGISIHTNYWD